MKKKPLPQIITIIFISCLIAANITAVKIVDIQGMILPAGIIVFPITYIIGDIVTEIYGFKTMKKVILLGFFANIIVTSIIAITIFLPPASFWGLQEEYKAILGQTPIILVASLFGYLAGSISNSWSMERIKSVTKGKYLWLRIIVSTIIGEGLDTIIFILIAFWSSMDAAHIKEMIVTQWFIKVGYEILVTPFTYVIINKLNKKTN